MPARPLWSGFLRLSLVTVPVKLFSEMGSEKAIACKQLHLLKFVDGQFPARLPITAAKPNSLEDHQRTLRMLERFRGAKLTYVDAASLAWIEHRKITTVWSSDRHLGLTGAEILPRF